MHKGTECYIFKWVYQYKNSCNWENLKNHHQMKEKGLQTPPHPMSPNKPPSPALQHTLSRHCMYCLSQQPPIIQQLPIWNLLLGKPQLDHTGALPILSGGCWARKWKVMGCSWYLTAARQYGPLCIPVNTNLLVTLIKLRTYFELVQLMHQVMFDWECP